MIENISDFHSHSKTVIELFNDFCKKYDLANLALVDHICLKCSSNKIFENIRQIFEFEGRFVFQSIISKRRIDIVGLKKPLESILGEINFLELSDQKPDNSQKDVFDHIEIIPREGVSYEELVSNLKEKGVVLIEDKKPHHTTYETALGESFFVKISREKLIEKIKRDEMI